MTQYIILMQQEMDNKIEDRAQFLSCNKIEVVTEFPRYPTLLPLQR